MNPADIHDPQILITVNKAVMFPEPCHGKGTLTHFKGNIAVRVFLSQKVFILRPPPHNLLSLSSSL